MVLESNLIIHKLTFISLNKGGFYTAPTKTMNKNNALINFSRQCEKISGYPELFSPTCVEMKYIANGQQASTQLSGVDEKTLIAILMHFRVLNMKKSGTYFPTIAKTILDDSNLTEFHKLTRDFLDVWNRLLAPSNDTLGGLRLSVNDSSLSAKKILDLWMNEGYFHAEQYEKGSNKGLDAINSQPFFSDLSKLKLIDLLQHLATVAISFKKQVVEKLPQP